MLQLLHNRYILDVLRLAATPERLREAVRDMPAVVCEAIEEAILRNEGVGFGLIKNDYAIDFR